MQHDAFFFIGIFVFIFLIWVATGGPTHPIAFTGPTLPLPQPIGGGTYLHLPQAGFGIGNSNVQLQDPLTGTGGDTFTPGSYSSGGSSLSGISFGPPSQYRGTVTLSHYVSGAGSTNAQNEYLTLYLSSSARGPVAISGWAVVSSATGNGAQIPMGTEIPRSGTVAAIQPIVLNPGDTAILDSGRSPIGASFRENKCIGYFNQFQSFSPSLQNNCPSPTTELQNFYGPNYIRDASCINYVNNLNRCQLALTPPQGLSSSCENFLQGYLNYNGCVNAHQNDLDFRSTTWRIYLGSDTSLWRTKNEVIKLVDASGNTVDAFSY